jgi:transposase
LYKLKTGVQWEFLPVKSLISSAPIQWGAVYHHYRKWCKDGSWRKIWIQFLLRHKQLLAMSTVALDGTHSTAKRGGDGVGYQKRKKARTSNILVLTDSQGLAIAFGKPVAGNHHDLYKIKEQVKEMLSQLKEAGITTDGLFLNADTGFDCEKLVQLLEKEGIKLNAPKNKRRGKSNVPDRIFDEEMYEERFVVERNNAWFDSFRTLLARQDTTVESWWSWHFISAAFWMVKPKKKKV